MIHIIVGCGTHSIPVGILVLIIYYYLLLLTYLFTLMVTLCEVLCLVLFCVDSPNQITINYVEMEIKY